MKDKKINVEISIKENKINISCDLNDLQEIARLIMVRDDLELNMDSRNISLSKNTNSTKITTDNDNPESISIFLLDQLSALTGWKLKTRDRYSTIRSFRNGILGKSALYFSLGRDNVFNLSIHNHVLNSALTEIYWIDGYDCHLREFFIIDDIGFDEAYKSYVKEIYGEINESLIKFCLSHFPLKYNANNSLWHSPYKPDFFAANKRYETRKEILLLPFNDEKLLSDILLKISDDFNKGLLTSDDFYNGFFSETELIEKWLPIKGGLDNYLIAESKNQTKFFDYTSFLETLSPNIAMPFDNEKRFSGTKRLRFSSKFQLQEFLDVIQNNLQDFLNKN
jgi:hypothetical protein